MSFDSISEIRDILSGLQSGEGRFELQRKN